ncbi:MAG: AAA family ATPase, partial [Treponema sp.]|nr:AAA family ATPase [Treponema sp.]
MIYSTLSKVSKCTESEAYTLAFYLYQLFRDIENMETHEECQTLYFELVDKLKLEKHSENVLNAYIDNLIKLKKLTPITVGNKYKNPFNIRKDLERNFSEDDCVFDNCGSWLSNTVREINLIRVLFADAKSDFSGIVAHTFFTNPEDFSETSITKSGRVKVPAAIKTAVNDLSSIKFAVDVLKLSKNEAKLLKVAYFTHAIAEMYDVSNDLFRNDEFNRYDLYARCAGLSQKEVRLMLKGDQKLKAYGFIDCDGDMEEDAMDAIYSKDIHCYFTDIIKNEKPGKTYEPSSFSVSEDQTKVALQLLKSNNACNILLYGAPGSGKTEFAKALIKQSGLKMTSYKNELEVKNNDDSGQKALARLNCYLSLKRNDSILLVDEAETVLQTCSFGFFGMQLSSPQKGTVNKMLENSENKVIWIVNYTNEMDESTLRRFTYSIKFNPMPKETLRSIAGQKLKSLRMPANLKSDILDMCGKYKITGASVENVVKAIEALSYKKADEDEVRSDIETVLEANSSLLYGKKKIRDSVCNSYDLSVLNASVDGAEIVEMLQAAEEYAKENRGLIKNDGVRILFYGASGTGKTELARYIAETLQKPLLLKRCSDLIDKYVGSTEQNIAAAFEEAEASNSILLFDEADSFFADRNRASQAWERNMVNEFLTQMEEFSGICICTT